MSEDLKNIPRRMRRYYRKGEMPPEQEKLQQKNQKNLSIEELQKVQEEVKRQSSEIASREIRRFKEKFNRLPKAEEFDEIAESIYNEVKKQAMQESKKITEKEELHGRFRHARPVEQKNTSSIQVQAKKSPETELKKEPVAEKKENINIEELLKGINVGEEFEKEKKESLSIEDLDLETEDLKKSLELLPEENSENILKSIESEKNTCPNCNNKTEHLIFCPNCGSAFCIHCAKQAKALEDKISYVCPKCNLEFKARKMP